MVKYHPSSNTLISTEQWRGVRNWRASETLSGVYKFELVRYVYIYIAIYMYGGTYVIIVAHVMHM